MRRIGILCRIGLYASLAGLGLSVLAKDAESAAPATTAPSPITVLELPPSRVGLPGAGRERAHHALSIATDAPKPLLRSLGLDASECSLRFRLPSRLAPSRGLGAGLHLEVQAQAGLGCRF